MTAHNCFRETGGLRLTKTVQSNPAHSTWHSHWESPPWELFPFRWAFCLTTSVSFPRGYFSGTSHGADQCSTCLINFPLRSVWITPSSFCFIAITVLQRDFGLGVGLMGLCICWWVYRWCISAFGLLYITIHDNGCSKCETLNFRFPMVGLRWMHSEWISSYHYLNNQLPCEWFHMCSICHAWNILWKIFQFKIIKKNVFFQFFATNFVCTKVAELAGSKAGAVIALYNGGCNSVAFWFTLVLVSEYSCSSTCECLLFPWQSYQVTKEMWTFGKLCAFVCQILHDKGFNRKWSLLIVAAIWVLGTINTLLLLPKYKVGQEREPKVEKEENPEVKEKGLEVGSRLDEWSELQTTRKASNHPTFCCVMSQHGCSFNFLLFRTAESSAVSVLFSHSRFSPLPSTTLRP